jgi:hypothetical protein
VLYIKQFHYAPWRLLGEQRYSSFSFLTLALDGGERSTSRPLPRFTPGGRTPGTHWIGVWVDPRAGLDTGYSKNPLPLPGIEPRSPGCPVCSKTLYWLSYPGFYVYSETHFKMTPLKMFSRITHQNYFTPKFPHMINLGFALLIRFLFKRISRLRSKIITYTTTF